MEKIDLNTGQFIFKAGEKSDKVFLLLEGEVGIFLPTNDTQQPNHKIQENEIFGEMGVINNELRSASARCLKDSTIIAITDKEFNKEVGDSNIFVKGCLEMLSHRLRQANKKL